MFADAEMQVFPGRVLGLEVSRALIRQSSFVRWTKIGRASEQPGNVLRKNVQRLAGCVPPGDSLRIGGKDGKAAIPACRQFAPLHQLDLVSQLEVFRSISLEEFGPLPARFRPSRAGSGPKERKSTRLNSSHVRISYAVFS